jgi:hypothetical protein
MIRPIRAIIWPNHSAIHAIFATRQIKAQATANGKGPGTDPNSLSKASVGHQRERNPTPSRCRRQSGYALRANPTYDNH